MKSSNPNSSDEILQKILATQQQRLEISKRALEVSEEKNEMLASLDRNVVQLTKVTS